MGDRVSRRRRSSAPARRPQALWRRTLETVCEDRRIESLLSHTLDRVALKIPPERTVIATCRAHGKYMEQEFTETPRQRVLVQPEDRGTAAGIFFPAHWIDSQDPEAVVAVFPSDHFILQESTFMSHVANVAAYVQRESGRLVLFGATANESDTEYGWIEPGEHLGKLGADSLLHVNRFWEKPSEGRARACLASGCLWNTLVLVARISPLLDVGRRLLPRLMPWMARATRLLATERPLAIEQEYGRAAKADFSRTILEACPALLAVSTIQAITWSDLGTPPKVRQALQIMASRKIDAA